LRHFGHGRASVEGSEPAVPDPRASPLPDIKTGIAIFWRFFCRRRFFRLTNTNQSV
jgi:hypothetical protein